MEARKNKSVVAFFCGTGYDFDHEAKGYVSQDELKYPGTVINEASRNVDVSFPFLSGVLNQEQERFGYDGCHLRGGGAFAYGIEQPAEHLYQELKRQLKNKDEKITLVLTAHSRGCLSALLLTKKLNADKELKKKVEVVLDFRDPVPGNFKITPLLPFAKYATAARQLNDFRSCTNVKAAHITVQEKGMLDYAFDVLVPRFSPETRLEVDYLPGIHDIQERDPVGYDFTRASEGAYLRSSPVLHFLGLCQSLKIYSENGVNLDYRACLSEFRDRLTQIVNREFDNAYIADLNALIERRVQKARAVKPIEKEEFDLFIEKAQLIFYKQLLKECKKRPDVKIQKRHLHFGGEYLAVADLGEATHLNMQHALLSEKYESCKAATILLGFKGRRVDLSKNERAAAVLEELRKECLSYFKYHENKKVDSHKLSVVGELYDCIKVEPTSVSFDEKAEKIAAFALKFNENKSVFKNADDSRTRKFFHAVSHILASVLTLGIYVGIRAGHSSLTRGSAKFWKDRDEVFSEKVTASIKDEAFEAKDSKSDKYKAP